MNKLTDLRNHLLNSVPALKRGADRLLTFIEDGKIEFWPGENLSHILHMPAKIIVTDWNGSADDIIVPVLEWMQIREPGRDPKESVGFEVEIINASTVDILLTVQLTERVIVKKAENGYDIEHVLPPAPITMNADAELEVAVNDDRSNDSSTYPEPTP